MQKFSGAGGMSASCDAELFYCKMEGLRRNYFLCVVIVLWEHVSQERETYEIREKNKQQGMK